MKSELRRSNLKNLTRQIVEFDVPIMALCSDRVGERLSERGVVPKSRTIYSFCLLMGVISYPTAARPRACLWSLRERTTKARTDFLGCPLARVGGGCIEEHS